MFLGNLCYEGGASICGITADSSTLVVYYGVVCTFEDDFDPSLELVDVISTIFASLFTLGKSDNLCSIYGIKSSCIEGSYFNLSICAYNRSRVPSKSSEIWFCNLSFI